MNFKENLNLTKLPSHIAVIMDGNGRWAKKQGFLRAVGHNEGVKSVRDIVEGGAQIGIKFLTLYAFSTENWNRPKLEVDTLMKILVSSLKKEIKTLQDNNIKLTAIGNIDNLPKKAKRELLDVIEKTKHNAKMTLILALSYGSREEITSAVKALANKVKEGTLEPDKINDSLISESLYTKDIPDVDLMIRTSGEQRISNFLLWQMAYAELYFTSILWPDFRKDNLYEAIYNYQNRERRFGKTSEQLS
ncbi:MAG: isoprenyl transferase [Zunongwangia sp.]|jgi:undecaprenyl diphosphate synthase|uniref:Isoprenyl transferase n=2 Tax=Zunongwangia profunda TaxID=398743 RepID=D5BFN2_ZUNPS|nr:isoprenyl transferase [Zunongwangia profunda]MAG88465.1 isoprenyl transferase [Flavobacteriaceae bacterium]MAO34422.1 isoprenyl transferase [Zunongwangia sp.]ADF50976.1 undecaprenyl-pyrophosphate synthetase [Zunongwangia profunda SM-A87]MAS72536.1 isoprenyl transferase [Zunongwangia sp.]MCC4227250.1 isoprenyl transferase [Zunongwangia profunda]|tara:strand:+ start:3699 stop:4439 length:741 start_codon:yes stop_codon:yes gene_type:complete